MAVSGGRFYHHYVKRPMDLVLSLTALVVLSPVLLVVAVLVRMKLGSPVVFRQERAGLHEEIFTMYKFRTMLDRRNEQGEILPDGERLTPFGNLLRVTSLDELPELVNIIWGDMSLVGPRPLLVDYLPHYTETERLRHTVRPGLTGLAQVNGRNRLRWDDRLALDVAYARRIHFWGDMRIMLKTAAKILAHGDVMVDTRVVEGNLAEIRKLEKQQEERSTG